MDTKATLERVKKEAAPQLLRVVGVFTGLCIAHVAKKNVPFLNSLVGDTTSVAVGAGLAIGVPGNEDHYGVMSFAKDMGIGISVYGVTSGVSRIGAPLTVSGIKGLGAISVPDGLKSVINKVVPQLNGLAGLGNADVLEMIPDKDGVYRYLAGLNLPDPKPLEEANNLLGVAV